MKSSEIKKILKEVFPDVRVPWCTATEYDLVDMEWLAGFLKKNQIDTAPFIDKKQECEWFALQLHADVKKQRHCFFGEAFGDGFRIIDEPHNLNICVGTDERVYCVSPQTDRIWLAKKGRDNVLLYKA